MFASKPLINRHTDRKPTIAALFTLSGPAIASKLVWTCRYCQNGWKLDGNVFGSKESITYHPDKFGNDTQGFQFYPKSYNVNLVAATTESYFERNVVSGYWEEFSHGWLSAESKSEAYNMSHKDTEHVKSIEIFFNMNPMSGKHFDKKNISNVYDDDVDDVDDDDNEEIDEDEEKKVKKVTRIFEMKRKALSQAVRNYCLIEELKDRKLLETIENTELFGPKGKGEERVTFKESVDDILRKVDDWRKKELYPHRECSSDCKKRGCAWITVADGLWKLSYPICMYDNSAAYPKDICDVLPQDCTNPPKHGKAFCNDHCEQVEKLNIPTGLRQFIAYCGADSNSYDKDWKGKVKAKLAEISERNKQESTGSTSIFDQGIGMIIENSNIANKENVTEEIDDTVDKCRKDIGEPTRLRRRNRGILAFVSAGGIIRSWDPLYKSEGPTQVALLMIKYLKKFLKDIDPELWMEVFMSYDNMCHVDSLKLLKFALSLEEPFPTMWQDIQKVIDPLHISNHKQKKCEELYNPAKVREAFPDANLMTCEQTFAWLGRFKKVLNSTNKTHYHFLMHRLILCRNRYTEHCYKENRRPLLPSAKVIKKSE